MSSLTVGRPNRYSACTEFTVLHNPTTACAVFTLMIPWNLTEWDSASRYICEVQFDGIFTGTEKSGDSDRYSDSTLQKLRSSITILPLSITSRFPVATILTCSNAFLRGNKHSLAPAEAFSFRVFQSRKRRGIFLQLKNRLASGSVRWHSINSNEPTVG
jgi:hypothetical protein